MTAKPGGGCPFASRRGFLTGAGGIAGGLAGTLAMGRARAEERPGALVPVSQTEPFWGERQGGILTPSQSHTFFAAFDLTTGKAADLQELLRAWTQAAARMAQGQTAGPLEADLSVAAADSGEAMDLSPARLTLTFGFGRDLFEKDGHDRFGLAGLRPEALVDMPLFNGDQLVAERSGGDLSVQACADDPQVAFHAVRQLARMADGVARMRWAQAGFSSAPASGGTPRNLMGFKDGSANPLAKTAGTVRAAADAVWVGDEGPAWLRGGSYLVVRRIRVSLEHWDRTDVDFQQQVVGREKRSGAPLGGRGEFDAPDLEATNADGTLVIPDDAHLRLACPASNDGAQMLRRGFSYNDGANFTAERWPPWRQGVQLDAGLFFIAYQRDPRTAFIRVNDNLAKLDGMNQYTTHTGSGMFACPGGVRPGGFIGQGLFGTV